MNLKLMYSSILLRSIAQVLLLNHLPIQDPKSGDTTKSGKKPFPGPFCKFCKMGGRSLQRTVGTWITKPITNWKKATQKMKSHSKSEVLLLSCQLDVEADKARKEGSIISKLQNVGEQQRLQRLQNRKVIKALI